jgi:hypothetical protein
LRRLTRASAPLDRDQGRRGRPSTHLEIGCAFTPKSSGDPDFVLARVRAGRERVPVGCGGWIVSRTYVGDIGPAVERALEREQARGEASTPRAAIADRPALGRADPRRRRLEN